MLVDWAAYSVDDVSTSALLDDLISLEVLPLEVEVTVAFAKALLTAVEAPLNLERG